MEGDVMQGKRVVCDSLGHWERMKLSNSLPSACTKVGRFVLCCCEVAFGKD